MVSDETEIKNFLNIGGAGLDDVIEDAREYADDKLLALIGQPIEEETKTVKVFGNGKYHYTFQEFPINSITSVTKTEFDGSPETITSYELHKISNVYRVIFEAKLDTAYVYEITYKVGYTNVPDGLKKVANFYAIQYVLDSHVENDYSRFGIKNITTSDDRGNLQTEYIRNIEAAGKKILNKYSTWI